jgi:predicted small metal-binding protein
MTRELHCGEIIEGCNHVITGATEEEVLEQAVEHAREAHGVEQVDAATAARVRAAIRDA